jgi:hypothetical protein
MPAAIISRRITSREMKTGVMVEYGVPAYPGGASGGNSGRASLQLFF